MDYTAFAFCQHCGASLEHAAVSRREAGTHLVTRRWIRSTYVTCPQCGGENLKSVEELYKPPAGPSELK